MAEGRPASVSPTLTNLWAYCPARGIGRLFCFVVCFRIHCLLFSCALSLKIVFVFSKILGGFICRFYQS